MWRCLFFKQDWPEGFNVLKYRFPPSLPFLLTNLSVLFFLLLLDLETKSTNNLHPSLIIRLVFKASMLDSAPHVPCWCRPASRELPDDESIQLSPASLAHSLS